MDWLEAVVHTTTFGSDLVSDELMALGAAGTEIVDRADVPDPRQPGVYWELYDPAMVDAMPDDVLVKAWFERGEKERETLEAVRAHLEQLRAQGGEVGTLALELTGVKDEDWSENWKKYYKPFRIGAHLVVRPTWEAYEAAPGDLVIELDPGMAFGTGTHETTSMCMQLLEKHLQEGMRVMDVGTGSGILAIAALKLGAAEAEGVDIDPMCVRTAGENAERNGVAEHFTVLVGDLSDKASGKYNIITANIVAAAILSLAPHVPVLMAPGARFIASGIIDTRKDEVLAGLRAAGLEPVEIKEKRGWVCVICKNAAEV